ncbi:MAG: long-chain fatty acid--CoA ligase [Actinobacteria bacterium]|nr:long-chain fatty acid--CoA ligase [Actinomycetota bacterium]NBR66245.1 long-chain fatty acid--CoA ligase [Actinomycetota bacterium]
MNLARIIDGHPDASTALISHGRTTTYGQLRRQVAALRAEFVALGLRRGECVALLCGNTPYFVVSYLAAVGVGAVVAPLNPTSPAPEIEKELAVVQPAVVIIEPAALATWERIPSDIRHGVRTVMATEGHGIEGAHTLDEVFAGDGSVDSVDVDPSTPAVYMFTSGTAGSPKAAVLTHGNLLSNIEQSTAVENMSPSDVTFGVLPMYHIFGLNVMLCNTLAVGASIVLVQRFDPVSTIETLRERGVTVMLGAPSIWMALNQLLDVPADAFAKVRLALSGAAKLPEQVIHSLSNRFGLQVLEGYGLTEASPVVTTSIDMPFTPGSIGRPVPGVEVRIVDENGDDAFVGDSGEIWVRGPNVFAGYLNDPEATARVLSPDGWLRTGDIAVADEAGHIFMVDRAKDLIIVSGFNVFPAEVEEVLTAHPDIVDAAVVGTAHPHTGEAVRAYVVLRPGTHLDEDTVVDHCRAHLARYKCPSKVLFVDQVPRNMTGKLQRYSLR